MKVLVTYYSRSGNTKEVAEMIADALNREGSVDLEEIIDLEKRDGPLSVMKNGAHSSMKKSTDIQEPKYDPSNYDLAVICSPVWAWKITPAARAYCRKMQGKIQKTAYVLTSAGEISEKTWATFTEEGGQPVARIGIPAEDRKTGAYTEKVRQFTTELKNV